jgi:hypothetical protein
MLWCQTKTHEWLGERAILAGKNKDVEERNNIISQSPERATATRGRVQLVNYKEAKCIHNRHKSADVVELRRLTKCIS